MIFASKSTLSLNNLKILRPKDMKNLKNLPKKFYEFPPWHLFSWTNNYFFPLFCRHIFVDNKNTKCSRFRLVITKKTKIYMMITYLEYLISTLSQFDKFH